MQLTIISILLPSFDMKHAQTPQNGVKPAFLPTKTSFPHDFRRKIPQVVPVFL